MYRLNLGKGTIKNPSSFCRGVKCRPIGSATPSVFPDPWRCTLVHQGQCDRHINPNRKMGLLLHLLVNEQCCCFSGFLNITHGAISTTLLAYFPIHLYAFMFFSNSLNILKTSYVFENNNYLYIWIWLSFHNILYLSKLIPNFKNSLFNWLLSLIFAYWCAFWQTFKNSHTQLHTFVYIRIL